MPLGLALGYRLAHLGLFRPLKDVLGFLRLKRAYTGGAALGPDTLKFFQAIGVNLKQLYGQTEAGITVYQPNGDVRHETVGKPLTGMDIKISPEGEVLVKSPGICKGYYKREDTFQEALTPEGYFRSGDAGYFSDDGHLIIIDRISDVMHTADGEMFSPQFIENKLKFSPFIKEAVVYGNGQDYITAMLNIDPLTVGKWAEDKGISYTTYMDLSQNPQVAKLILEEANEVNRKLKPNEQVHRLVLLYKLLDADDEELTRTGKVRRGFIAERYKDILQALYDKSLSKVMIKTDFKYQDGQVARIETEVGVLEPLTQAPSQAA